jgi:hypothetical protein
MLEKVAQQAGQNLLAGGMARHEARMATLFQPRGPSLEDQLEAVQAENRQNHKNAVVNAAMCEGYEVQIRALAEALRSVAPHHPILGTSGQSFQDGKPKSKLRVMFENAFDKKLLSVGGIFGVNPKIYRKN